MGQILPSLHQAAVREVGAGHPGQGGRDPGGGTRLQAQGTTTGVLFLFLLLFIKSASPL